MGLVFWTHFLSPPNPLQVERLGTALFCLVFIADEHVSCSRKPRPTVSSPDLRVPTISGRDSFFHCETSLPASPCPPRLPRRSACKLENVETWFLERGHRASCCFPLSLGPRHRRCGEPLYRPLLFLPLCRPSSDSFLDGVRSFSTFRPARFQTSEAGKSVVWVAFVAFFKLWSANSTETLRLPSNMEGNGSLFCYFLL